MSYIFLYYNEQTQKLRSRKLPFQDLEEGFILIGAITRTEKEFLVEILFTRFGEKEITLKQMQRYYSELKNFCERVKSVVVN
jgi:hypothetical protein